MYFLYSVAVDILHINYVCVSHYALINKKKGAQEPDVMFVMLMPNEIQFNDCKTQYSRGVFVVSKMHFY